MYYSDQPSKQEPCRQASSLATERVHNSRTYVEVETTGPGGDGKSVLKTKSLWCEGPWHVASVKTTQADLHNSARNSLLKASADCPSCVEIVFLKTWAPTNTKFYRTLSVHHISKHFSHLHTFKFGFLVNFLNFQHPNVCRVGWVGWVGVVWLQTISSLKPPSENKPAFEEFFFSVLV